jgi:hypothetical protein
MLCRSFERGNIFRELVVDWQKIKRDALKMVLGPWLSWSPLTQPKEGFSIVLGVPWALRHLLPVNLEFVQRTDIARLQRIFIVFDRIAQEGGDAFIEQVRQQFPRLPLSFSFHPAVPGRIVEKINQSKFYASMNWTLGLAQCETPYAIMHDFDLYPLVPNYFTSMVDAMRERKLRFTGLELTHFDGLDTGNGLIGTWALGIDVAWLRQNYRPIQCFHAVEYIGGKRFDLDAFTYIESMTPERALVGVVGGKDAAHVRNLCSTYLRFSKGENVDVVWRLHLMWYLEALGGNAERLAQIVRIMDQATSSRLSVEGTAVEFAGTHVTCANVLRDEIIPMEKFMFGQVRPETMAYADAFERFLWRFGRSDAVLAEDGTVRWSPDTQPGRLPQGPREGSGVSA